MGVFQYSYVCALEETALFSIPVLAEAERPAQWCDSHG